MIEPSLQLNFAKTRQLDRRISFSRADTADNQASYYDANGILRFVRKGEPRFTHDPSTGDSLGLLIEEARTNLLTYSEQFDNAAWVVFAPVAVPQVSISANSVVAPDGNTTGDTLVETTGTNVKYLYRTISVAPTTHQTVSIYAKAVPGVTGRYLCLALYKTGAADRVQEHFDLVAGTKLASGVGISTGVASGSSITPVGNGWYKCTVSGTPATSGTTTDLRVFISTNWGNAPNASYTGDGTSGIYIWGAQLEAGAFPTSYIPCVASTVTRPADSATMTGANFSGWVNAAEGTILAYYDGIGWLYNNTPPTTPLDIKKQIDDYTTAFDGAIRHLLFYPRELTTAERTAITASLP